MEKAVSQLKDAIKTSSKAIGIAAVILLVIIGTVFSYLYSLGYRFNSEFRTVEQTGVITITSSPTRADIMLDDKVIDGKTPKSISALTEDEYLLRLSKKGYHDWQDLVSVKAEKTTIVYPFMIKEEPDIATVHESEEKVISTEKSKNLEYFFITTIEDTPATQTDIYRMYRFDLRRPFWDISENPTLVIEKEIDQDGGQFFTLISPDGRLAVMIITHEDGTREYSLLHTVRNGVTEEELDLSELIDTHTLSWAESSNYLLFESDDEVVSMKLSDRTTYTILEKDILNPYIYSSDLEGFFYTVQLQEDGYYTIIQKRLDGSEERIMIQRLYSLETDRYIKVERENEEVNHTPFTNAPENTRLSGDVTGMNILQNLNGMLLNTEHASYWYNLATKKYIMISEYPSQLISVSPRGDKLLLKESETKNVVTFTVVTEEFDHTSSIKAYIQETRGETYWLENSRDLITKSADSILTFSHKGTPITPIQSSKATLLPSSANDKYFLFEELEEGFIIQVVDFQ
jgi:hypothetical protein